MSNIATDVEKTPAATAQPSEPETKPKKPARRARPAKKPKASTKAKPAAKKSGANPAAERSNKKAEVIAMMKRAKGVTLAEIALVQFEARTDWVGFVLSIEGDSDYAARAACQISGILAVRPPSLPILN
jgi:hypothetical protein